MKHEIVELYDMQIIGMSKKIAFNEAKEECPKFWGEFVEKIIKPVIFEKQEPNAFQKAAFDNGIGEFGLCTCDIPNHNCATCAEQNFGTCSKNTFTYVIGGIYKGGEVPAGMQLFPIHSGKWLKMHFEGGMKVFRCSTRSSIRSGCLLILSTNGLRIPAAWSGIRAQTSSRPITNVA